MPPIESIKIKNCKSLKDINIKMNEINLLIGENGTGKTNVIRALDYFYSNLTEDNFDESLHDISNPYSQFFEITIEYNLKLLFMSNFNPENNVYSKILYRKISENNLPNEKTITLTLKQFKDEKPNWNQDYNIRQAIKNLYPFYLLRTCNIEFSDWQLLWDIIGDLSRLSVESKSKIDSYINEIFFDENKNVISRENEDIIRFLKNKLDKENIDIKEFNSKEVFTNLAQLFLGGKVLKKKERSFDYYSDGTNLFEYLNVIIDLVNKVAEKKLAEPIILIDEPEMGLHNCYVDLLSKKIVNNTKDNLEFILATHSPRFTKHILKKQNSNIFHFRMENNYSNITRMQTYQLRNRFNIITDSEASLLFAKAIVYLEGDSDMELFLNDNIIELYPNVNRIEFYHNLSETKNEVLLTPKESAYSVPYLFVIDMDNIIQYEHDKKKFILQNKNKRLNPLKIKSNKLEENNVLDSKSNIKDKEKYFYGKKRDSVRKNHNYLKMFLDQEYIFDHFLYSDQGTGFYNALKQVIKDYMLGYNIFVNDTTIEGLLINEENYKIFHEWLINDKPELEDILSKIFKKYQGNTDFKVTVYRLIVNGKLNSQKKFEFRFNDKSNDIDKFNDIINKYKGNLNNKEAEDILVLIEKVFSSYQKTSGWITKFLSYFFRRKYEFKKYFIELDHLLSEISKLV